MGDSDILATTTAVIVILLLLCLIPLVIYSIIISGFVFNRDLQYELKGGNSADRMNNNHKKSSSSSGLLKKEQPSGMVADGDDDDSEEDIPEEPPLVLLSCNQITYKVKKSGKTILGGVNAWFAPKTLTAILGTSGKLLLLIVYYINNNKLTLSQCVTPRMRQDNIAHRLGRSNGRHWRNDWTDLYQRSTQETGFSKTMCVRSPVRNLVRIPHRSRNILVYNRATIGYQCFSSTKASVYP